MIFPFIVSLAGVTYNNAQESISLFGWDDLDNLFLVRERDNPYDKNAIRVVAYEKMFMGYIPRKRACQLAPIMDAGGRFSVRTKYRNEHPDYKTIGLSVEIDRVI